MFNLECSSPVSFEGTFLGLKFPDAKVRCWKCDQCRAFFRPMKLKMKGMVKDEEAS